MKRRRRTEILIQERSGLAQHFAEAIIQNYSCQEVVAPQYGLTMIKMRESAKNSLFYLGEVLVTEAKMEINQCIGIGIVAGMKEELAKHLAIIDAAYKAQLPETERWHQKLVEAERRILQEKAQEQAKLFETKVDFETMDV
ncbi:phosphonate C-P lyase system protein PhnG [Halobacillus karajensis]|uniref:Phosphonate C-P lyase system protein PhnG n=1 Tax=Halobacillus karajensis TaxID=195088 RepID=A0A024P4N5_9BACI|nr:phosphonate C-P lyase system protein PhnG [Halobacillus karajensis]CDQ20822.1 phosphonate C-P lyase system protein PhnG [Halobacillus karajensis]CDQ23708.1 phosphonate C-P lyase system protein PhnG [Halobacillus karajensis]CDQ27186.1 phosphonate C-P lyase system protein PhnG [Halobacillus karajensis]